jgi:predicted transcriptional regulator/transcriptional regulator with XRE-family HTH domain
MRSIRKARNLTQRELAASLGISTSYLNQIENNQRPLTATILLQMVDGYGLVLAELNPDRPQRLLADLAEIAGDPVFGDASPSTIELKALITSAPNTAASLLRLYDAYRRVSERLADVDQVMAITETGPVSAYEEVRDFFQYADNYVDALDRAAETLAISLGTHLHGRLDRLIRYLEEAHRTKVELRVGEHDLVCIHDRSTRTITVNLRLEPSSQFFHLAAQLAHLEQGTAIDQIVAGARFNSIEAGEICRIGLANYYAGALQMPYANFLQAAETLAYDLDELALAFGASLEQVAHRLSTMQRVGTKGVPVFFARIDAAGTITKRHSAGPLQFARFGSACPLWNVHQAFQERGRIIRQLAETPDGNRYLCLAWSSEKYVRGYRSSVRRYAYSLGFEVAHAHKLIYANDLDIKNATFEPIGISCRICDRKNCAHRSVPPIAARIRVDPSQRRTVPYTIL